MGRIVVFGATGYTGELTCESLARSGADFVVAGRSVDRLAALADSLTRLHPQGGRPDVAVADVSEPASVARLVTDPSDVLISTVGPFLRFGRPAVDAALAAGAAYLDSTGEPSFTRHIFEYDGPKAQRSGSRLFTAFGFDYVPGNLAGALALADARRDGHRAAKIDIGYFIPGSIGISSGTAASAAGILVEPSYAWRSGHIVGERVAARTRSFRIGTRQFDALSVGGTENFSLPRLESNLDQVGVYLGVGRRARVMSSAGAVLNAGLKLPGAKPALKQAAAKLVRGSRGGPTPQERAKTGTLVVAEAFDSAGQQVSRVIVEGPSPYDLTGDLLAWAGSCLAGSTAVAPGAWGPEDGLGLPVLEAGCASVGLKRAASPGA